MYRDLSKNSCGECLPEYQALEHNLKCVSQNNKVCKMKCQEGFWIDWNQTTEPLKHKVT